MLKQQWKNDLNLELNMKFLSWILAVCFSLLILSCSGTTTPNSSIGDPLDTAALDLPATFTGEIPCPDCKRVKLTLNLRPDSIYQLRKNYVSAGGSKVESQMGDWRMAEDGGFIILGKGKGALKSYEIIDRNLLRFVGLQGVDAKSQIQYDLTRSEGLDLFTDSVKIRGMMVHAFGKSQIKECRSGQLFPITGGVEYRRMVQTYLNSNHGFGESVLVSLQGKLEKNPEDEEQITVDHFKKLYNAIDCEGNRTRANLTGTLWRLLEVNGKVVALEENEKRPYFMLDGKGKEVNGYGICNSLKGTYLVRGEVLLVKRLASSRMACTTGVTTESSFFKALDTTEKYRIEGDTLRLLNEEGAVTAVLRADY
jgi:copper homeostasis protein (lipoprotein)